MGSELSISTEQNLPLTRENAPVVQAMALAVIADGVSALTTFLQGQSLPSVLQARAKSEAVSAILSSAIEKLGFDASRFQTFAVEVPHLVDAIFKKIEERETAKAQGEVRGPDVNAEEAFLKWKEQNAVQADPK